MNSKQVFCFLCKYIIRGNSKTIIHGGKLKRCCSNCTSREHKILTLKYKNLKSDTKCTYCSRVVTGNSCICCTECNHFIHGKCAGLTAKDIKLIESLQISWTCHTCSRIIFPFFDTHTHDQ